jgi:hypothetical protein
MRFHVQKVAAGFALWLMASTGSPFVLADEAPTNGGAVDQGVTFDATQGSGGLSTDGSAPAEENEDKIIPALVPYMTLRTFGEERLNWISGGNHPNHKWVELKVQDGSRRLIIHDDNTYGTIRTDYSLDVDQGTIDVTMVRSPGISLEEAFTLPVYDSAISARLSYTGALNHMIEIVGKVAEGNDLGYVVLPPRPELQETQNFLKELMRRCMN